LSQPLYHYVLPATVFDLETGASYGDHVLKMVTKRWDTLAWFQITKMKGDFDKSFNVGTLQNGFGTAASGSSKLTNSKHDRSSPETAQKILKKQKSNETISLSTLCNLTLPTTHLAEFMALNETRANLQSAMDKCEDNDINTMVLNANDKKRLDLANPIKSTETSAAI
jgi:X-X-X-Leu-X-X-Gly heptad repeat protein